MTNVEAAEVLRDLGEALAQSSTIRVRALRATLRALAMAVVALEEERPLVNPYREAEPHQNLKEE